MLTRKNSFFLISLLTVLTFVVLFFFRSFDDNRLTSWQWVFSAVNAATVLFALVIGTIILISFSGVSFTIRAPGLFLFCLSFVTVLFFWRVPEVIVDSSRYFTQAKHLEVYGISYFVKEWGKTITAWTDLPLVPFLYGLIFRWLGESRLCIQIFTTLLFSCTILLTYLIGKELWDEDTGFYGGVLLLGFPYLLVQVPLMLVDVPTMFFLSLAIFAFIKALTRGSPVWSLFAGISIFLVVFSKYSTWPMLSVLAVIFLVLTGAGQKPFTGIYIGRGSAALAVALLFIGSAVYYKFDVFYEQVMLLMSYQKPGLKRWGESFVSTFFFQIHPFITIMALFSVWAAYEKKDKKYLVIVWLVLLLIVFQIRRIRYILPLFPMIALMASYGLQQIRQSDIRRFIAASILVFSFSVAAFAYAPFTGRMSAVNLKSAGEFLNTLDEKHVEVFTLPTREASVNPAVAVPLLDLYTKKPIIYQHEKPLSPPGEEVRESSLRFTWEYRNPRYYSENPGFSREDTAVVIINGEPDGVLPYYISQMVKDYREVGVFNTDEGIFKYKTFVSVYRRSSQGP